MKLNALALLLALTSLVSAQQPQQRRIVRPISNASAVRLAGTAHPRINGATDAGAVSATMPLSRMTLVFSRTAAQQAELDQLLADQQDPNSVNYHKWLTPEEFGDRFGLAQGDVDAVSAWLSAQGFQVEEVARSRTWIAFSGIAAQAEAAFHTALHNYTVGGEQHFAPTSDISVPDALANVVTGVTGLHNFAPRALNVKPRPHVTSSITGNHFIVPGDFATIYNLPSYANGQVCTSGCLDGTGQTIGIVGQSDLSTDSNAGRNGTPGVNGQQYDLVTFRNLAGMPAVNLTIKVKGTDPGVVSGDADEANLDVEWAGVPAPNAALIFYIQSATGGGNGAFGAIVDAVNDNKAQVISVSYGICETQLGSSDKTNLTNAGQQANAQGQAILVASGDSGAADCDTKLPATLGLSVDFPSSMPYATSVGGTTFIGDTANSTTPTQATQYWAGSTDDVSPSALSYIPETSWNDSSGTTPSATGGGVSTIFTTKPVWQTGLGVPNDNARDVPDISLNASPSHDQTVICSQSKCVTGYRNTDTTYDVLGGTSIGAPTFAGILALINQAKGTAQGNPNPFLYAQAASAPWAYNDITTGNNVVSCSSGTGCSGGTMGYSATAGYDLVTGLGSVNVRALINSLTGVSDFSVSPSATSVTLAANGSSSISLGVLGTSGSNITFACTALSPLTSVSCSAPGVTASGTSPVSSMLTVSTTSTTTESGTVNVVASNGSISHLVPIAVAVSGANPDFTMTVASPVLSIPSGTAITDNVTIASVGGFNSDVALTCSVPGSLGTTTCTISPPVVTGGNGTALITVTGAVLSRDMGAPLPFNHRGFGTLSIFAMALGVVFTSGRERRKLSKRRLRNGLFGLLLLAVAFGAVSCGGGSSGGGGNGPTPLTGNLTITGTGGGITHTTTINVTVH
jgi:subtilase family serine protease